MMLNQNTAVHFYGKRPPLAHALPAHHVGGVALAGPSEDIGRIYMPGSTGAKAIGGLVDRVIKIAMSFIKTAFPPLGEALSFVGDIVEFILNPVANELEAMAIGACTYLEEKQAQVILDDMDKNQKDYILDAFKDCVYAFYCRIKSTGNTVKDIKEGRDGILQKVMGGALDALGIGRTPTRVANRIYTKAVAAGAKDWQAAAAVCYGAVVGMQTKGFPVGFKVKVKGVTVATIGSGVDVSKALYAVGSDFDIYFNKLGTPIERSAAWIDKQYLAKSGGVKGDTDKSGGGRPSGAALPLLAVAAVAFLASR